MLMIPRWLRQLHVLAMIFMDDNENKNENSWINSYVEMKDWQLYLKLKRIN